MEASLARSASSSTSVRINAVDDIGAMLFVNSVAYVVIMVVNLGFIVAGNAVLAVHWGDGFCSTDLHAKWRWWVLALIVKKALTTPVHMVSAPDLPASTLKFLLTQWVHDMNMYSRESIHICVATDCKKGLMGKTLSHARSFFTLTLSHIHSVFSFFHVARDACGPVSIVL